MNDAGNERPALPEDPTVTLPLSQVVDWIEKAKAWEDYIETTVAAGATALTPELIRPDGKPTAEFAQASLAGALQDYIGIFMKAFQDNEQTSSLRRPKISPQTPKYINMEHWDSHVNKFGNRTTWTGYEPDGINHFETTHLQDATGNKQLVGFKVATTSKGYINTVNFTLNNGAISRVSHSTGPEGRFGNTEVTMFVLELEPLLLARMRHARHKKSELHTLRFNAEAGKFYGDYVERSFEWAQTELQEILKHVPEDYRPISPTR